MLPPDDCEPLCEVVAIVLSYHPVCMTKRVAWHFFLPIDAIEEEWACIVQLLIAFHLQQRRFNNRVSKSRKKTSVKEEMVQNILLDPDIRDWVLLPLMIIMIFVGMLRHYVTLLLKSAPKAKISSANDAKHVGYARLLLANGKFLSPGAYKQRIDRYCNASSGIFRKKVEHNPMEAMSDPSMMSDMMKNQMTMMIPNIGMMTVVSYFFSGFVIAKFPFTLSARTRGLTLRGVDIDNLECSYVTSLSMYFLILFGLQGILKLLLGENEGDESRLQMQMMQQPANQPVDYGKVFKQMTEEMEYEADRYRWALADATKRLLAKSPNAVAA